MKKSTLIIGGAVGGLVVAVLFVCNPTEARFFPPCLFHEVTGLHCPGCGSSRALHQLLHGHLATAVRLNPLTVLGLPVVLGLAATRSPSRWRPWWVWSVVTLVLAFGVLRNVPMYPFTLLAP